MPYHPDDLERRDPRFIERVLPLVELLSASYFDLRCEGEENIPDGPVVFACNHNNGILGPEVLCTLGILWKRAIPVWAMAHDFAMVQLTPLGRLLQRGGGVRATPENALRILERGQLLVYPGGDLDSDRHFSRRNEIVIAPRSGFVRVAQKANVRIVPVVAAGAHRSAVIVAEGKRIARALRLRDWARIERFPIAFALPWGIAVGPWAPYFPLPFGVRLRFLPARSFRDPLEVLHDVRHVRVAAIDAGRHERCRARDPPDRRTARPGDPLRCPAARRRTRCARAPTPSRRPFASRSCRAGNLCIFARPRASHRAFAASEEMKAR